MILEEFLEGFQGTCEGILHDGKVVSAYMLDRQTVDPPHVEWYGASMILPR